MDIAVARCGYEKGAVETRKGKPIDGELIDREEQKDFELNNLDRFRCRTRYFTDSGIIGSKKFVGRLYGLFRSNDDPPEKRLKPVAGLVEIYSLKRLAENIS